MLHFSCDLCGCDLNDRRYVAKIEVSPAFDPDEFGEDDLDADHLQEISELIAKMILSGEPNPDEYDTKSFRFDLCPNCMQRYLRDPLGRDTMRRLNFSEN